MSVSPVELPAGGSIQRATAALFGGAVLLVRRNFGEALLEVAGRDADPAAIAARSGGSWDESAAALLAVLNDARGERREEEAWA